MTSFYKLQSSKVPRHGGKKAVEIEILILDITRVYKMRDSQRENERGADGMRTKLQKKLKTEKFVFVYS